jgi:hypothetical protein
VLRILLSPETSASAAATGRCGPTSGNVSFGGTGSFGPLRRASEQPLQAQGADPFDFEPR